MSNFKHISVAGTIGAGKSTLIKSIVERFESTNERVKQGRTIGYKPYPNRDLFASISAPIRYVVLPEPHEVEGSESFKYAEDYFGTGGRSVSLAFQGAVLVDIRQQLSEAEANADKDVLTFAISERCWLEAGIFWNFLRAKRIFEEQDLTLLSNTRETLFKDKTPDAFIWVELSHVEAHKRAVERTGGRNIAPLLTDFQLLELEYNYFFKQICKKVLNCGVSIGGEGYEVGWELAKMYDMGELKFSKTYAHKG